MKRVLFIQIERAQDKAIALNDLKTAMKLNWLKYSIDSMNADDVFEAFQSILLLG